MVFHRGPKLERGALFRILTLPGIHFTAASKSPAEESLSSGFAEPPAIAVGHFRFRQDRLEA